MPRSRPSAAGGFLVALGAIIGSVVGYLHDQPSAGLLVGVGVGTALAVLVWLRDRAR